MAEPTNHALATEIAVLKQTMETHKQEYKTDIARLAEQLARRENRLIFSVPGIMVAGITIFGFILTSTPSP